MSLELLKKYNIKPKKSLWQNFLIDERVLDDIVKETKINWKNILEIWPWLWALTEKLLLQKPRSLYLVELDQYMIEILNKRVEENELDIAWVDFKIINIDVLKYNVEFEKYNVIANIPYYITSPILYKFLYEVKIMPEKMLILMQKDVADKIMWERKKWKTSKSSVLSLFISKKCIVKEVSFAPASSFYPAPKVDSEVLLFETHNTYEKIDDKEFLEFIKTWFRSPRKKLINNLVEWWYEKEKVFKTFSWLWFVEDVRGEDLDIDQWILLLEKMK